MSIKDNILDIIHSKTTNMKQLKDIFESLEILKQVLDYIQKQDEKVLTELKDDTPSWVYKTVKVKNKNGTTFYRRHRVKKQK